MATHQVYSKIVADENDIIGLIAYALYKQHKIEFFNRIKNETGQEPTDEAIAAFVQSSLTESLIKKYRAESNAILSDLVISITQEQINQAENEMLHDYQEKIKKAVKDSTPGKWKTIYLNVIGTLLFSVIITIVFIIGNFSERGSKGIADQIVTALSSESQNPIETTDSIK